MRLSSRSSRYTHLEHARPPLLRGARWRFRSFAPRAATAATIRPRSRARFLQSGLADSSLCTFSRAKISSDFPQGSKPARENRRAYSSVASSQHLQIGSEVVAGCPRRPNFPTVVWIPGSCLRDLVRQAPFPVPPPYTPSAGPGLCCASVPRQQSSPTRISVASRRASRRLVFMFAWPMPSSRVSRPAADS